MGIVGYVKLAGFIEKARWVQRHCRVTCGWRMPAYRAFGVVWTVERTARDRILADVVYANMDAESGVNPCCMGDVELEAPRRSYGLKQVTPAVARTIQGRRVGATELMMDMNLNVRLGVIHLRQCGTIQGYNAGPTGASLGGGCPHARKVIRKLRELPWVKRNKTGGLWHEYARWFDFKRCGKAKK